MCLFEGEEGHIKMDECVAGTLEDLTQNENDITFSKVDQLGDGENHVFRSQTHMHAQNLRRLRGKLLASRADS